MRITMPAEAPAASVADRPVAELSIAELRELLDAGRLTSIALVDAYLARIEAYDRQGPRLNSVREINPDVRAIALRLDAERSSPGKRRGPLHGIPILLKDNIATADRQTTTAGSLALAGATARRDAWVARRLRAAGAILLGKANMTEFANAMTVGMPGGYSSLGGQVLNPHTPTVDADGIPVIGPSGSSSGSAVATTACFAAAAIGTETSGSLLSPASVTGLVTVKPTVGLISRAGIIPIAGSQDTAGPMTRTVRDAAILLGALTGIDHADPATRAGIGKTFRDYTRFLDPAGLRGTRIGVPSDPADPANDVYYGPLPQDARALMAVVLDCLRQQGAILVEASIATAGRIGGPATVASIPVTNRFSPLHGGTAPFSAIMIYEMKRDLNAYLRDYARDTAMTSLADIIAFNDSLPDRALRFGQDTLIAMEATRGDLSEPAYTAARREDLDLARRDGIDAYLAAHRLDAILFPGSAGASIAAKAGYPSICVPAGFRGTLDGRPVPDYPFGVSFTGPAFSEPMLFRLAYAYEQASLGRRPPPLV